MHADGSTLRRFLSQVLSHMPTTLVPTLPQWVDATLRVLELASQCPLTVPTQLPRARAVKRALQICVALVTRHRSHVRPPTLPSLRTRLRTRLP